jgi:prepilin-type N-terminal cleavage/methylation domain-containing protein
VGAKDPGIQGPGDPRTQEPRDPRTQGPRDPGTQSGFTLVELLIVFFIVCVLASLAAAGFRHSRARAGEAVAVAGLHTINQAQFSFAQTCGSQRYSQTLAGLGAAAPTTGKPFISPDMARDPVIKSGYQFVLGTAPLIDAPTGCNGVPTTPTYFVTADPMTPGLSGVQYYATNTDRVIYADTATYVGNMPGTGAPGHGVEVK